MSQQSPDAPAHDGTGAGDAPFDELVARYVDRVNSGEMLDKSQIIQDHPGCGHEILEMLEVFRGLRPGNEELAPIDALGDYALHREIGRGGMGVVYEAWQRSMHRQVALKILPVGAAADDRAFHRFMRGARAAGQLSHPHIVPVHGIGVEQHTPYYSMEYVEGETLGRVLERIRAAVPSTRTELERSWKTPRYFLALAEHFACVADGLQHAHSRGVVHRDIKPSNLILDQTERLRILDFGLARIEGQENLTLTGDFLGTPNYMSPEQARIRATPVDHRTDIFSFGATLYECLTGKPPFRGPDQRETLSRIIHDDPSAPRRVNAAVPMDLERIVLQCLAKRPDDRYQSCQALAQDLRRFACGEPVEARPPSSWERTVRMVWRRRVQLSMSLLVALCLCVSAVLLVSRQREENLRKEAEYQAAVLEAVLKIESTRLRGGVLEPEIVRARGFIRQESFQIHDIEGDYDPLVEAVFSLKEAIDAVPIRADAFYHLARAHHVQGRDDNALESLNRALKVEANFVPARMMKALILEGQGRHQLAQHEREYVDQSSFDGWFDSWRRAQQAREEGDWMEVASSYSELIDFEVAGKVPYVGSSAETRVSRGVARLRIHDYYGAVEDFSAARGLWGGSIEPTLLLGRTYVAMGEAPRGERVFSELVDGADHPDRIAVAVASHYFDLRQYDAGLRWINRVTDPTVRERNRVLFLVAQARHEEAVQAAERAVRLSPDSALAFRYLGWALEQSFISDKAVAAYERAVALDPDDAVAVNGIGRVLWMMGRLPEAEIRHREAIQLAPGFAVAHNYLGNVLRDQGRLDEAVRAYQAAVDSNPRYSNTVLNLLRTHNTLGTLDAKIRELVAATKERRRSVVAWIHLGAARKVSGDHERAIKDFEKVIELNPAYAPAYLHVYVSYMLTGHGALAQDALERLISVDPLNPTAHALLGWISRDEPKSAEVILRRALEYKPNLAEVYGWLGVVLQRQDRLEEATSAHSTAIKLNPRADDNVGSYKFLIDLMTHGELPTDLTSELKALAERIQEARASGSRVADEAIAILALWAIRAPGSPDPLEAVTLARELVQGSNPLGFRVYSQLIDAVEARKGPAEALYIVEDALESPDAPDSFKHRAEQLSRKVATK